MATLKQRIEALATRTGNYLRDSVLPRLVPTAGTTGHVLTKTAGGFAFAAAPAAGGGFAVVAKAADEARTANVTLTADNTLVAALGVGQWRVRLGVALKKSSGRGAS